MKPEQRIAIAELCGWTDLKWIGQEGEKNLYGKPSVRPGGICVPDYTADLNAMHEAEKVLMDSTDKKRNYLEWLGWGDDYMASAIAICHATASQRAEAFLRTMGRWTE